MMRMARMQLAVARQLFAEVHRQLTDAAAASSTMIFVDVNSLHDCTATPVETAVTH